MEGVTGVGLLLLLLQKRGVKRERRRRRLLGQGGTWERRRKRDCSLPPSAWAVWKGEGKSFIVMSGSYVVALPYPPPPPFAPKIWCGIRAAAAAAALSLSLSRLGPVSKWRCSTYGS